MGMGIVVVLVGCCDLPSVGAQTAAAAGLKREGRSLTWNDEPIHLVGCSYYGLLGDRQFAAESFLETLAAHNINFTRFFLILPWPAEPGPNLLPFAKIGDKSDLRQFNDEYFLRLRRIVRRAEELGIICQICLFDRCGLSVSDRRAWLNNPYNRDRNVNGVLKGSQNGYPPFCHVTGPIAEINAAFIRKVVQTIGDRGNVIYEIINEPYPQLGPLTEWHGWVARQLRKNLKNRRGSQVISSTGAYDDEQIDIFSMHTASRDRDVTVALGQSEALNKPVILSDDGDMRSMFHPDVMRMAAERALRQGQHFEHLAYTITLQREQEHRPGARLDQMPGLCRFNLRQLAELSTPLLPRSYVRQAKLNESEAGYVLTAQVEHVGAAGRILCERSEDGGRTWSPVRVAVDGDRLRTGPLLFRLRTLNLVRIVCIDQQSHRWPGPAFEFGPPHRWSAELGDEVIEAGLFRIRPHKPDGALRQQHRGGRPCFETDPGRRSKYAYFRLGETFPRRDATGNVTIAIDYFDGTAGSHLVLEYDGTSGPYTVAAPVVLGGSGRWKSASFTVRGALFRGRQNDGADFRFSLQNPAAPLALRSVRLERPARSTAQERKHVSRSGGRRATPGGHPPQPGVVRGRARPLEGLAGRSRTPYSSPLFVQTLGSTSLCENQR